MKLHAFVAMPFGTQPGPDGRPIDFNRVYAEYILPALEAAELEVFRAHEETIAGGLLADPFQELLIADLVVADLTLDDPNVWYGLGVRHALRARGAILIHGPREKQPFAACTDCRLTYRIKDGAPDPETLEEDKVHLTDMAKATLETRRNLKVNPVFTLLPNLQEPRWGHLKVNEARAFWAAHEDWARRIELARRKQRIGDILVLAEEAPIAAFRAKAACIAAQALCKLERFGLALEEFDRCLEAEPGHLDAQRKKGLCLQRLGRRDEARACYRKILTSRPKDVETWALLGRIDKEAWVETWRQSGRTPEQMRDGAGRELVLLQTAIDSYAHGFKSAPGHYRSGLNAVTLMHLFHHLTGKTRYVEEAGAMAGGVRWASFCEMDSHRRFRAEATLGELEILTGSPERVKSAYEEAAVRTEPDWFALHSSLARLRLLNDLGFRPECVAAGITSLECALERLQPPKAPWQPRQVLLFSGHMVDALDRAEPRFPLEKTPLVAEEIARVLERLSAGPEDLALTQGASGGDLIFAEACQARRVKLQLLQPFLEPDFIERSVNPAAGEWRRRYFAVKAGLDPDHPPRCMPEELGASERNSYERCNLWLLYTALCYGPEKVKFICLWNGGGGDGPGGTQHMVQEVKKRTGQVIWLDTRRLW